MDFNQPGLPSDIRPAQPSAPGGSAGSYEFDEGQNAVFRDVAGAMRFVGAVFIVLGPLAVIGSLITLAGSGGSGKAGIQAVTGAIQAIAMVFMGIWTRSAGASMANIVATQGSDIPLLMSAMGSLRSLFVFQKWLLIVALIAGFLGGLAGATMGN